MRSNKPIVDLSSLYTAYSGERENSADVQALLKQTHWFSMNVDLDPKTGDALPQPLSRFLARVASDKTDEVLHDRLWRITDHARDSIDRLLRGLNESPRREHALLPIHAVRELDANSFIKLSNRPGRNIREKLGSKPYLQAVRRYQSVDLPENRLFKEFAIRLAEGLQLRMDLLGESEDALLTTIRSWLRSEEAQAISRWENLAPNNALLSHRDYRRVWDSWRWLQTLDEDIENDFSQIEEREETMRRWVEFGKVYIEGTERFADMPVLFDYDEFSIDPWISTLATQKARPPIARSSKDEVTTEDPVCVDLAALRPHYAINSVSPSILQDAFLWQHWKNKKEAEDITLFGSDAAYLHPEATTISSADLFFSPDNEDAHLDRAARAFAIRLRSKFKNNTLIWLVPDVFNYFELEFVRRNLNARFPLAEPLPRSVAATFEQVDYSIITGTGFAVVVLDTIGGKNCVTKLVARFDAELEKVIPETRGYCWERCPHQIIDDPSADSEEDRAFDIATVDNQGQWRNPAQEKQPQALSPEELKRNQLVEPFDLCINLRESPVVGGIRLHALKQRSKEIPLWCDQIPELSITIDDAVTGLRKRFYLVERGGRTVKPIRGRPVRIPVKETFIIPAGKSNTQNPLFQGENEDEVGFSLRLESPAFPLKEATNCKLDLTFEYGVDESYVLIFSPMNGSFPPVRAHYPRTTEITEAPAPEYPRPMSWKELRKWSDPQGVETNILEWLVDSLGKLSDRVPHNWNHDNSKLFFVQFRERSLLNRMPVIWSDGRSLKDTDCPFSIRTATKKLLGQISKDTPSDVFESKVGPLLACMHRDMNPKSIDWIMKQVKSARIRNPQSVGFALGDLSQPWQSEIFNLLASKPNRNSIRVFAYAIWREMHFVNELTMADLHANLLVLRQCMESVNRKDLESARKKDGNRRKGPAVRAWRRETAELFELLLGLLRTRASTNPEIATLLQPHQEITKDFAHHVERVAKLFISSKAILYSRVHLDVQKSTDIPISNLLYALRQYLTGDDSANAIRITGISDE